MKGAALGAFMIIIVAIAVLVFIIPPCFWSSSCGSGLRSSNDIITIGYTSLNPANPQPNTNVIWQMVLNNNADRIKIDGVKLHFFGNLGLDISSNSLDCKDGNKTSDTDCVFDDFYQFDQRAVFLTMRVIPNMLPSLLFKYFVNYNYNSNRSVSFPIIDGTSLQQPSVNSYFHQDPSITPTNPVSLNYQPQYTVQREINGQKINDSWVVSGSEFYMTLNFKLATFQSFSCEKSPCETAIIPAGQLKIDFTQSSRFITLKSCTCTGSPSSSCLNNETLYTLVSNQPIDVSKSTPSSIQCFFDSNITTGEPQVTGRIDTSYDVNYQFENMKSFSPG